MTSRDFSVDLRSGRQIQSTIKKFNFNIIFLNCHLEIWREEQPFLSAIVNSIVDIVKHKPNYASYLFKSVTFIEQKVSSERSCLSL